MSLPPAIAELVRIMPPPGTPWPKEKRVTFLQALDALLATIYGGETNIIWLDSEGEIRVIPRTPPAERPEAVANALDEIGRQVSPSGEASTNAPSPQALLQGDK